MLDRLEITGCHMDKLRLSGDNQKTSVIDIKQTTFKELLFDEVYNEERLTCRGVSVPEGGKIVLLSSNLSKADFISCDFSKAVLEFQNSKITEVFLSETDFPQTVTCNGRISHAQEQLAFGQLHTAFAKQGDTIRALEYQSREIEAHYKGIQSFGRKKFPWLQFTKINLGLNKLSNNFGRDWGRGITFSITLGLICFITLVFTTDQYSFNGTWNWDNRLVVSFFRFMNPLRFFDLEGLFAQSGKPSYITLTAGSYIVDWVGRIGLTYGYY